MSGYAALGIRLIGNLAITRYGEPTTLPSSRKTRALLAYLVLNPGLQRRERLCEIFWQVPDDPRGSLRWSLSKLRQLVDDDLHTRIIADREFVSFEPAGAAIDILDLRQALSGGPESMADDELAEALSMTSPGYLQGLDLSGQPEFDSFLVSERETFRVMRRDLLLERIRRLADAPAEALRWLYRLIEVEPYSLSAHVALIENLVRAGRKQDATKQVATSMAAFKGIDGVDLMQLRRAVSGSPDPSAGADSHATVPDCRPLGQEIRFCKAPNGAKIAYATVGDGPPLVKAANWLNHLEFDWESPVWRHVFRGLAEGRRLVRYDARGNGLSDWDVEDYLLARQVEDLETVVEAAGLDRFPLLGLSQGCAISIEYAARHPDKVTRLILIGGYARGWNKQGNAEVIRQTEAMITLVGIGWGQNNPAFRQMFTSQFMPDAPPQNQVWFNELQRISTRAQNAVKLLRAAGEVDVTSRLADVRAPTLVLHARDDVRVPFNNGRELAGSIPGARFVSLSSSNHLLPDTDPAWPVMLREINAFLAE
jgi:pimeloyl-ACP methyl ester carboxylesterase/DNA-binding SARP family transcriptional activator